MDSLYTTNLKDEFVKFIVNYTGDAQQSDTSFIGYRKPNFQRWDDPAVTVKLVRFDVANVGIGNEFGKLGRYFREYIFDFIEKLVGESGIAKISQLLSKGGGLNN